MEKEFQLFVDFVAVDLSLTRDSSFDIEKTSSFQREALCHVKKLLTFDSLDKILKCNIEMKASEEYFPLVLLVFRLS